MKLSAENLIPKSNDVNLGDSEVTFHVDGKTDEVEICPVSAATEAINGGETKGDTEGKATKLETGTTLKGKSHAAAIALSVWLVALGGSLIGYGLSALDAPASAFILGIAALFIGSLCSVLATHFAQKRGAVRDAEANGILESLKEEVEKSSSAIDLQAKEIAQLSLSIDKLRTLPMLVEPHQAVSTAFTELPTEIQGWKRVRAGVKYICSR